MRKLKLLFTGLALMGGVLSTQAQTDVTSTYLTNADFSEGTLASPAICTYAKDKSANNTNYANLVALDGWTAVDNVDGKAGGPVAIGSGVWIGGSGYTAPPTNSDGETTGNVLGLVACWSASAQYTQDLKSALPAGTYTIVLAVYNSKGGTNAIEKNLIGFKESGGTEHYASTKQYSVNTWKYEFITFTLTAETSGYITIGYKSTNTGSGNMPHLFVSGLELYEGEVDAEAYEIAKAQKRAKGEWEVAKAAAEAVLANAEYTIVVGKEKADLEAEIAKAEPTTVEGYNSAKEAINNAADALIAAATVYNALVTEIAYAKTIGVATETAESALNNKAATAASVITATQALKVLEYTSINTAYPNNVTSLLGEWGKGNYDTTSGQGYVGSESYFDKWSGSSTDLTSSKAVTLRAGNYVVCMAGRGESTTTMNLSVKVGGADAVSTPFPMNGDTGKGIDTDGATNFSDEGIYSNSNNGRGWQYRYITFTTTGEAEVTITVNGHLNNNTWQSFYAPVLLCDDDTYAPIALDAAKAELQAVINVAPAVRTTNIGNGAFQIAEAGVNTYAAAVNAVNNAVSAGDATLASIAEAKSTFESAIVAYNALEVNAPSSGKLFNIILTYNGWTYDQKAMTYMAGDRTDMGNYNIKYNAPANQNLAQAFTFTKVSGNNYKMSQIDAEGNARYLSTGVPYGGNTSQIRTTINADDALLVTVIPTNTEGVWNLKNTEADNYIGSQDAGVFTVNSHIDFNIVETTKPSITINTTAAGYGTTILPFAVAALPTGVKAYTCAATEGDVLTLEEVTALEANKPYIIEGSWEQVLTGDALGTALENTEGLLTGVYAATPAPAGSYVLQNNDNKVGFYLVGDDEGQQPTVGANRCYLTDPEPASARPAYFFFDNETTGIAAVNALTNGEAEIFNASGVRVPGLQKGMNIVRKADGTSYKVVVK